MRRRQSNHHLALILIFLSIACISVTSCKNNSEIYYHYNEIKDGEWAKYDTLYYTIDSTLFDTGMEYDIALEVTNNVNYPYQNIWFFVRDNIDNDSIYSNVQKEFLLADKSGKWKGSGFGSLYQTTLGYKKAIRFADKRNYTIKVVHGMRDDVLSGIEKVGIKVSRHEAQ